ncbi:hypothetical protein [Shewanella xiamenensis]|uniref:Uncharacterized protein n=1 Tax=Shewanella xiamenensis TaxID=332186 RepID=A0ABT6UGE7_9GAMM|nr:hypothetical protein [Shewanella xiamenensis]MDI5833542.1 hypothetical protein [Shewanella xiamenensis]
MNDDLSIVLSGRESQEQFVQVPIKKKDFGNFITSLLGQPETIVDRKVGRFEASHEWLVHLHHLLNQRIKQQALSDLVDFSAIFSYNDGPDRKVTTIEGFLHFNEAKLVVTKSVKITWTYLINFPNKPSPEKQEITLQLIADRAEVVTVGNSSIIRNTTSKNGMAMYSISHTERTWGDDIQSLISREIDSIFEKEKWYVKIITFTVLFVSLGFFAAGLIVPDYLEQIIKEHETATLFSNAISGSGEVEGLTIDEKLNLALKILDPANQLHQVGAWFRVLSFVGGIFIAVLTLILFDRKSPSFILVTNEDKKNKLNCTKKANKSLVFSLLSFMAAVAAGVAGNYVYYLLNI